MQSGQLSAKQLGRGVLPGVKIVQEAEGIVLLESKSDPQALRNLSIGVGVFYAIILGVAGVLWAIQQLPSAGIVLIFGAFFSFSALRFFQMLLVAARLGQAKLLFRKWPVHLGDVAEVRFVRTKGGNAKVKQIKARLICTEVTSSKTELWSEELTSTDVTPKDTAVEATLQFPIPLDAPPSLPGPGNNIIWSLEVTLSIANAPDVTSSFPFLVESEGI